MKTLLMHLFKISLVMFVLGGTALVLGQILGLIFGNGEIVIAARHWFAIPTFVMSTVTSMLGSALAYVSGARAGGE